MKYRIAVPTIVSATLLSACVAVAVLETAGLVAEGLNPEPAVSPSQVRVIVDAGLDSTAIEGETVILTGSAVVSADPHDLVFEWSQTNGPMVVIDSSGRVTASFVAPPVDRDVCLTFRLRAGVSDHNMHEDSVNIIVKSASATN